MTTAALECVIVNQKEELERLNSMLADFGERENLPESLRFTLDLVMEELILNIITYGYEDDLEHEITISIKTTADNIEVEVVDDGRPFNPLADAPEADLHSDIKHRRVGGLGIHLVKEMMDTISYHREDDRNHMKLFRRMSV